MQNFGSYVNFNYYRKCFIGLAIGGSIVYLAFNLHSGFSFFRISGIISKDLFSIFCIALLLLSSHRNFVEHLVCSSSTSATEQTNGVIIIQSSPQI